MRTCDLLRIHLECVLRVVQAVDPDVILHGRAGDRAKNGQFEALSGRSAQRLAHQTVCTQRLCQDVAGLVVHLNIARRGEVLLTDHHHVLQRGQEEQKTVTQLWAMAINNTETATTFDGICSWRIDIIRMRTKKT